MCALRLRIRELRLAHGWTQEELAQRSGVRRVTINRIENGRSQGIEFDVLDRLARALHTDAGVLFTHLPDEDHHPSPTSKRTTASRRPTRQRTDE